MTNDINILSNIKEYKQQISVAKKNQSMLALGSGNIETDQCILKNVSFVPELSNNLISVNAITENGGKVVFTRNKVEIIKNENVVLEGNKNKQGLYVVNLRNNTYDNNNVPMYTSQVVRLTGTTSGLPDTDSCNQNKKVRNKEKINDLMDLWHKKLGHLNNMSVKRLSKMSTGMPSDILKCENTFCTICIEAKHTRYPFNTVRERGSKPLHIIHSDVCGLIQPTTHDGRSYFRTCIDDYTHFCKVYLLKTKSEANQYIKEYINEAEAYFNLKAHKIRCDNGGEYVSTNLKQWCKIKGIVMDYSIPSTPQLNGTAERMNRTLLNKARAMIFDSNLTKEIWGEAVLTAAYLLNRSPFATVDKTPAEKWYGKMPDLSRLQVFGSVGYSKILGQLKKLDRRSKKMIFVGYALNGYRMWDGEKRRINISRDVIFEKKNLIITQNPVDRQNVKNEDIETENEEQEEEETTHENRQEQEDLSQRQEEDEQRYDLRPRINIKGPSKYCLENDCRNQTMLTFSECMMNEDKQEWITAINKEIESLKINNTWTIVNNKQTPGKEILSSRWLFKIKDDGTYKARLVVRGCQQKGELDFKDTFSPVVDGSTLRVLFAIAAKENLQIQTFDVKTAFLYGEIEEEIYMKIPEGFEEEGKICKLNKALYGLKQAPSKWNKKLTSFLKENGLMQLKTDQCIFKNENGSLYLAIHVDDGIIMAKELQEIQNLLKKLKENFEMTSNENLNSYLGMEINRSNKGIHVTQTKYANQVLKKCNMTNCKEVTTPIVSEEKTDEATLIVQDNTNFPYREAIESLLYLTNKTRPDMAYAVNYESRSMEVVPSKKDIQNVKRTLRYLKGTKSLGIFFSSEDNNGEIVVEAYCDSDYAGDVKDRKSTSGYVLMFGGSPVLWSSRKQQIIALSTAEAEYISAAECCKEIKYIKTLITELTGKPTKITLNVDNQSAIKLIKSGQMNRKSKHIDVRYHFVSEQHHEGMFDIKYCCSDDQLADVFTKPLSSIKFRKFKDTLLKEAIEIK
uniref:Integrase catalytic domain-containing protein n=2 Tax=Clastoptera arizonana TaxID=38151 RepID=A0A1B6C2D3_9HEMI